MPEVDLLTTTAFEIAREAFLLITLATPITFSAISLEIFTSLTVASLALSLLKYFLKNALAWLYQ